MDKLSPPVVVSVTFKDAAGEIVTVPENFAFVSSADGVSGISFNPTQNADGTYSLTISPSGVGTDSITVPGLSGSLSLSVTPSPAVSVEFSPSSL